MPITTSCPDCSTTFRLPDSQEGKKVRCKNCRAVFTADPSDAPVLSEADPGDFPVLKEVEDVAGLRSTAPVSRPAPVRRAPRDEDDRYSDRGRGRGRDRDDEPDPEPKSGGSTALIVGGIAGLVVLLMAGGGLAWFLMTPPAPPPLDPAEQAIIDMANNWQNQMGNQNGGGAIGNNQGGGVIGNNQGGFPPINVPPPKPRDPWDDVFQQPKSLDDALVWIEKGGNHGKNAALNYFATGTVVPAKQKAVKAAIERHLDDNQYKENAINAAFKWDATLPFETLSDLARRWPQTNNRKKAMERLVALGDEDAAEALAKVVGTFGLPGDGDGMAANHLVKMGEVGRKVALKHLHDSDGTMRDGMARVVAKMKVPNKLLVEQALTDMDSENGQAREGAMKTLEKCKLEPEVQEKVSEKLATKMAAAPFFQKRPYGKALETWATRESLPAVHEALTDNDRDLKKSMMKVVARLKDDSSILPLKERLYDFDDTIRLEAGKALLAYGAKAELAVLMVADDTRVTTRAETRAVANNLLVQVGTMAVTGKELKARMTALKGVGAKGGISKAKYAAQMEALDLLLKTIEKREKDEAAVPKDKDKK